MLMAVVNALLIGVQGFVLAGVCHLLWPLLVIRRREPVRHWTVLGRSPRIAVLVAARNEASVINTLLTALASQSLSRHCFEVLVVADGCSDQTAAIARRAGATVWERPMMPSSTKGEALAWLWSQLDPAAWHGVVLFDADNAPDPECLAELTRALEGGAQVVQGLRIPGHGEAAGAAGWDGLGELCQQWIGAAGRARLGMSVPILGSGVAFRTGCFQWLLGRSHRMTLVEDADWMVELALAGIRVQWCPEARVRDCKTANWVALRSQRRRWLGGRVRLLQARGWALVWAGLRHGRFGAWDVLWQLLAPPRMVLALGVFGLAFGGYLGMPVWPLWPWVALALLLYVAVGVYGAGNARPSRREGWVMLLALPRFVWELLSAAFHAWSGRAVGWQVTPKGRD
jgi:cellulose synthase/poly-beta-1,6-N-acetylglucosamine synthase-like glycosyltransferase